MRLSEMIYTEEEMQELREEIRRLSEKNKIYSNALVQEKEKNRKLKECNKSQSEVINNVFIPQRERLEEENRKLKEELEKRNKLVKYYRNEKKNLREKVKELKKDYISTREEWLNTD